jgi:hypothetical protein
MRRLSILVMGIALSCVPLLATPENPGSYPTTFLNPRIDVLAGGRVVINVELQGEHRGLLTFNVEPASDGVLGGTWVLAERYTDNTDPATGVEPAAHEHETAQQHEQASAEAVDAQHQHRDYVRYIDNGTISGTIDIASFDIDADGKLTDFRAQLTVTAGSVGFDGVSGTGLAELTRGLILTTTGAAR